MNIIHRIIIIAEYILNLFKLEKIYSVTNSINPKFDSIEQVYNKIITGLKLITQLKPGHPQIQRFIGELSVLLKNDLAPESLIKSLKELNDRYPTYRAPESKYDEVMIPIAVAVLVSHYTSHQLDQEIIDKISKKKQVLNRSLTEEEKSAVFEEFSSLHKEFPWSSYTEEQKMSILNSEKYQ